MVYSVLKGIDLICFSHLRWNFVYQRPQHLMTRFAKDNRVFFIEEPVFGAESPHFTLNQVSDQDIWIFTPHLPDNYNGADIQAKLLQQLFVKMRIMQYVTWYYSPMALAHSNDLKPLATVYDCMDELSAFRFAPATLKQYEAMLFSKADIVFTGGHHLYEAKQYLHHNIHPFPSSIDKTHFIKARNKLQDPTDQANIAGPRIGFYGVIDERFNVSLLRTLAKMHPEWNFILIGPIVKIEPSSLPQMPNIHLLGGKNYDELPVYLSGWDIAMMPFALNESTKYISPTKTPEYLAGGKPVVSTSIRDVVIPYGKKKLVEIADTAREFSNAIKKLLKADRNTWLEKVDEFLMDNSWDNTQNMMSTLIRKTLNNKTKTDSQSKMEAYV